MTERTCTIEGCERKHIARGLCGTCYKREQTRSNLSSFPTAPTVTGCTMDGCDAPHRAHGLCHTHHERWLRHGDTDLHIPPRPTAAERLAAGLERKPNGCLEWTGLTRKGYGMISVDGKTARAHRFAWELVNGPIPPGISIRHFVCDNPPCCDVAHLRMGTHADNMADRIGKTTHCPQDHEYTKANAYTDSAGRLRCRACKRAQQLRRDAQERMLTARRNLSTVPLIDTATAAVALDLSPRRIRQLVAEGKLRNHGTPRKIRVSLTQVRDFR